MKFKHNSINYSVNTVDDLSTISGMEENDVVVVTDEDRGGTFIYRSAEDSTNNGGTIFNGWCRQYDGAVNVKWFGADIDGVVNALNLAFLYYDRISLDYNSYPVAERININGKTLLDGELVYTDNNAKIVMSGDNPTLENLTIKGIGTKTDTYVKSLGGIINLHLSTNAKLKNIIFEDGQNTTATAILCTTKASNTEIDNIKAPYTAWGVLFNDQSPISSSRVVDGIDYSEQAIGDGFKAINCVFGVADKFNLYPNSKGDCIEINCPTYGFSNVEINDNKILSTVSDTNIGLGIACANVINFSASRNYFNGVQSAAGALHAESCEQVNFSNNVFEYCVTGIGGGANKHLSITGGSFRNINNVSIQLDSITGYKSSHTTITGVTFDRGNYHIVASGASNINIVGNTFSEPDYSHISLNPTDEYDCDTITIIGNTFINSTSKTILGVGPDTNGFSVKNIISSGNNFSSYTGDSSSYVSKINSIGLCSDTIRLAGTLSGLVVNSNINPEGYIQHKDGGIVIDGNNGELYLGIDSTWMQTLMPIKKTSSELSDSSNLINIKAKFEGKQVYNSTLNTAMWAAGPSSTSSWINPNTTITPS